MELLIFIVLIALAALAAGAIGGGGTYLLLRACPAAWRVRLERNRVPWWIGLLTACEAVAWLLFHNQCLGAC